MFSRTKLKHNSFELLNSIVEWKVYITNSLFSSYQNHDGAPIFLYLCFYFIFRALCSILILFFIILTRF